MTLGEKIQELRRKRGMSQDELAEKLDISRQAVSKWERDEAVPETEKIIRIAQEFGVSIDYLLLDHEASTQPQEIPRQVPVSTQEPSAGQQVLRGFRRHGYKSGYAMLVCGGLALAIAVLIMALLPGFGSGMFDIADGFSDSAGAMIDNSGFGSFSPFGDVFHVFDQQVDQMETVWTGTTRLMAMLVSAPLLLIGIALLIGGVIVIVKGKKVARTCK